MDKIIKTSKTICAVLKVLFWVAAAISAVSLIAIVVVLFSKVIRQHSMEFLSSLAIIHCSWIKSIH